MTLRRAVLLSTHPRIALVISGWLLAFVVHFAHVRYLNPAWEYFGFTYWPLGAGEFWTAFCLVTVGTLVAPAILNRPSSIVTLLLLVVVYIPTIVITLGLGSASLSRHGPALLTLAAGFSVSCLLARQRLSGRHETKRHVPDAPFGRTILAAWMVVGTLLVYEYGAIMAIAALEDVYEQRAAGASTSLLMGYLQTYFGLVLSPALIAAGAVTRRPVLVAAGVLGCAVMYMITAQRTIILLPLAMGALHFMMSSRIRFLHTAAFPVIALAASVLLVVASYDGESTSALATYLVFRTLGIPALTFSQYFDVFAGEGLTWWSHVRGVDLLVAAPAGLASDPYWPRLGYLVGDRVYGDPTHNVNANLFSGDGVAAAGALGVLVIGSVLAGWLALLDRAASGWDRTFAAMVIVPVALALTNGHFFTSMLSFGGLFWLVVLHFYKPRPARRRRVIWRIRLPAEGGMKAARR